MSEPRDDDAPTGPFRVEVTDGGCEHCSAGKTWGVVYPDGTLSGSFYESEEDAEDACFMFNAGYALGRDENKSGGGWISVRDRLPDVGQSVALVNIDRWEAGTGDSDRNVHAAGYRETAACASPEGYWCIKGESAMSISAYTHWMPLPEPPKPGGVCTACQGTGNFFYGSGHTGEPRPCPECHPTGGER